MDERDFELLATLKETRNITHAADLLYVTQYSLSKRISAIEQELGVTLILRSRQGIHFTPEGEEVLRRTAEAAHQLRLMRETIDASRGYVCGTLNAGISINYALYCLPDILADYQTRYPHVITHIQTDYSRNLYTRLLSGAIDVAILRGEYEWTGSKILLGRENICAICPGREQILPLHQLPYIGRKTDRMFEREMAQWMREQHFLPERQGIYADNITTCVELVSRGLGWSIVPEICLKNFTGSVFPLSFQNGEPFVRSTYLMYYDTVVALPQVKAFIDTVKKQRG